VSRGHDHSQHHPDVVSGGEFLVVTSGGKAFAGEMRAHSLAAGAEEIACRAVGICCRDRDGEPVSHLSGMRKLLLEKAAHNPSSSVLAAVGGSFVWLIIGSVVSIRCHSGAAASDSPKRSISIGRSRLGMSAISRFLISGSCRSPTPVSQASEVGQSGGSLDGAQPAFHASRFRLNPLRCRRRAGSETLAKAARFTLEHSGLRHALTLNTDAMAVVTFPPPSPSAAFRRLTRPARWLRHSWSSCGCSRASRRVPNLRATRR
jgi:hypothetical protein